MPLDPLAKRFLAMMAAASPGDRSRPSSDDRRQAFAKAHAVRTRRRDGRDDRPTAYCRARPAIFPIVFMRPPMRQANICRASCSSMAAAWSPAASTPMTASARHSHKRPAVALFPLATASRPSINFRQRSKTRSQRPDGCPGTAASLGIDAAKLVVGGDSAGATLAAVVCQDALRNAGPPISAQCLICPVLDFEETSPSRDAFAENHLLDRITLEADLADYLPDGCGSRRSQNLAASRDKISRTSRRHYPYRRIRSDAR